MKQRVKPEQVFLLIGGLFGLLWFFIIPPFQVPDDFNHFDRAYMISEGHIVAVNSPDNNLGDYLPISIHQTIAASEVDKVPFHYEIKQNIHALFQSFSIPLAAENTEFVPFYNTCLYSPVPYLPQAFGIGLGRLLNLPVLALYYLGRFFTLVCFMLLVYWAIQTTPVLKLSLLTIALLPIVINETASVSADPLTIGFALCFTAYFFRLLFDERIKKIELRHFVILYVLSIAVSLSKTAYFPLCLLYFLIPKTKFSSTKNYWLDGFILILCNLGASLTWSAMLSGLFIPLLVDPHQQLASIFQHPLHFIKQLTSTQSLDLAFHLGWLDMALPPIVKYGFIFLTFLPCIEKDTNYLSQPKKCGILMISLFFILYTIVHILIYLSWPQHNDAIIEGIQGRYFIPIILLLIAGIKLLISPAAAWINLQRQAYLIGYGIALTVLLAVSSYAVLLRYYTI